MSARGWDALDVLLVTGDAYVDHPAFAAGILAEQFNVHLPFWIASGALLLAIGVLATGHQLLARADEQLAAGEAGVLERAEQLHT